MSKLATGRPGCIWTVLGALLVAAACALTIYNLAESNRAADFSARIMGELGSSQSTDGGLDEGPGSDSRNAAGQPLYERFPDLEMPTVEIEGYRYVGTLEIPSVGLKLPVMQTCDETRLKVAPCRYTGSAYRDDMVIAAHNYASHFGKLFAVEQGAQVVFTDVEGNRFLYKVIGAEIVDPYDVETMTMAKGWDLTLFTCTYGGRTRYTVRCERVGDEESVVGVSASN